MWDSRYPWVLYLSAFHMSYLGSGGQAASYGYWSSGV